MGVLGVEMEAAALYMNAARICNRNKDYDMLLLFSDGVTDCISDEDMAVVCRTTDKKALARRIVEKALKNDTFIPEEFIDYSHLRAYKPAGWDNATVAIQVKNKDKEER